MPHTTHRLRLVHSSDFDAATLARMHAPLPKPICLMLIVALSLAGWFAFALCVARVARADEYVAPTVISDCAHPIGLIDPHKLLHELPRFGASNVSANLNRMSQSSGFYADDVLVTDPDNDGMVQFVLVVDSCATLIMKTSAQHFLDLQRDDYVTPDGEITREPLSAPEQ